jgi:DNA mismatch endonuclease, patch repair protein
MAVRIPPAPAPSSSAVTAAMRGNRSSNTRPEIRVRQLLFRLGYRYRTCKGGLPGRPDICFSARQKVIFVHGCFWHQHADTGCPLKTHPRSNLAYWTAKLERNVQRDRRNQKELRRLGWSTLTIWECETGELGSLEKRVEKFLGPTVYGQGRFS